MNRHVVRFIGILLSFVAAAAIVTAFFVKADKQIYVQSPTIAITASAEHVSWRRVGTDKSMIWVLVDSTTGIACYYYRISAAISCARYAP